MNQALTGQLQFSDTPLSADIDLIHRGTAIYTAEPEIEALLDQLDWPSAGSRLLDPGAGNGGFIVAALARLPLSENDIETAVKRVRGYEFHAGAAQIARREIERHLVARNWTAHCAREAASKILEIKDFLLSPVPVGQFDIIAANPPYWRILQHLPPTSPYRYQYENQIPAHAKADLLYAYLDRAVDICAPNGRIGLITADRWLLNQSSARLREKIGARYTVIDIKRLESSSAFYRPKARRKGTPARVHPVSLLLSPGKNGRALTAAPFPIDPVPEVAGTPLSRIAKIRLAPWLGPDGIFTVTDPGSLPPHRLVPCVEPEDICSMGGVLKPSQKWAIRTEKTAPEASVLQHLENNLGSMPSRGRRSPFWLPPESFSGKLPLAEDAILIPRIATRLRPILLPAGTMPINHNLVVVSGHPVNILKSMIEHPLVQAQANSLALRLENGYRSYTATLLRRLIIPEGLIPD